MKDNVITISDVAEALGVSKTTVSRAISGKGRIGEATRKRVLDYIEEHDYKPNVIAKGLAQSKTFNLCVVIPENYALVDLPFFQEAITGIQEIAGMNDTYDCAYCICASCSHGKIKPNAVKTIGVKMLSNKVIGSVE